MADLDSFAQGLKRECAAAEASLTLAWRQGHVEGRIARLKPLKRRMYGRVAFDLRRAPAPCRTT